VFVAETFGDKVPWEWIQEPSMTLEEATELYMGDVIANVSF
jgi:hypothetical protein